VIQTCVLALQEGLLQQVLIVLQIMPTFAAAALPAKLWYQACVPNVLWAKQRLDLLHRAMRVPRVNTKIKIQRPRTVAKSASPASTATKLGRVSVPPANPALLVVGLPRWVLKSVPELLALRVLWASTIP
jgi:hypothetical protein